MTERYNLVARKQLEKSFEHGDSGRSFGLSRRPVTQHTATRIKRMPRKRIPEDELFRLQTKVQQRAPDDRGSGLGKTVPTFRTFACARSDPSKDIFQFTPGVRF